MGAFFVLSIAGILLIMIYGFNRTYNTPDTPSKPIIIQPRTREELVKTVSVAYLTLLQKINKSVFSDSGKIEEKEKGLSISGEYRGFFVMILLNFDTNGLNVKCVYNVTGSATHFDTKYQKFLSLSENELHNMATTIKNSIDKRITKDISEFFPA